MNKKLFINFIILSAVIFGGFFLFCQSAQAGIVQFGDKNIFVDFDELPFDLSNWAPGISSPPKTIAITNNEDFDINVYFGAKKTSGDEILADVLTITIDGKPNHLSDLFDDDITLGSVNSGESQNYSIVITFDQDAGNEYQNKSINFDFIIIAEQVGKEGEGEEVVIPGGVGTGGGAVLIGGLEIFNENVTLVETATATVTWQTNYSATSRVIYDTVSHPTLGSPLNYGYAFSTPEQDQDPKVTFHSIRIDGLTPGTAYFYRTVSRASPEEVSGEHSFTTLTLTEGEREEGVGEEEEEEEEIPEGVIPEVKGEGTTGEGETEEGIGEEEEEEEEEEEIVIGEEKEEEGRAGAFLAAIGQFFSGLTLENILWILLIIAILLLIVFIFSRRRKKKISQKT